MNSTRGAAWLILTLLVLVVLSACGGAPEASATLPPGSYSAIVAAQEVMAISLPAPLPDAAGTWMLTFDSGNRYVVTKDGVAVVDGHYAVTGEKLTFNDELGVLACAGRVQGVYQWQLVAQTLTLSVVEDGCALRQTILTSHAWNGVGSGADESVQMR